MIITDDIKNDLKLCDGCTTVFWWTGDDEAERHYCDFCLNKIDKIKEIGKRELREEIKKQLPKFKEEILQEVTKMLERRFLKDNPPYLESDNIKK